MRPAAEVGYAVATQTQEINALSASLDGCNAALADSVTELAAAVQRSATEMGLEM